MLEAGLGKKAIIQSTPRPVADVAETCADLSAIEAWAGYRPTTPLRVVVPRFVEWFLAYEGRND